jgi:hypothetical protein
VRGASARERILARPSSAFAQRSLASVEALARSRDPQVAAAAAHAIEMLPEVRHTTALLRGEGGSGAEQLTAVRGFAFRAYASIVVPDNELEAELVERLDADAELSELDPDELMDEPAAP